MGGRLPGVSGTKKMSGVIFPEPLHSRSGRRGAGVREPDLKPLMTMIPDLLTGPRFAHAAWGIAGWLALAVAWFQAAVWLRQDIRSLPGAVRRWSPVLTLSGVGLVAAPFFLGTFAHLIGTLAVGGLLVAHLVQQDAVLPAGRRRVVGRRQQPQESSPGPGRGSRTWLPLPGLWRRPGLIFRDSSGADATADVPGPHADDLRAAMKVAQVVFQSALAARATAIVSAQTGDGAFLLEYRVDGKPKTAAYLSSNRGHDLKRVVKSLAGVDVAEVYRPQHGGFCIVTGDNTVRVAVSTSRNVFGERFEARLLYGEPADGRFRDGLAGIGMPTEVGAALSRIVGRHKGLVLICGPRESGRTTTLYAVAADIGPQRHSIVAIEETPLCELADVKQEQVNRGEGRGPAHVIADIMWSNPEVILLDEIRDHDAAIAAAHTAVGRVVVATLEADDAAEAIVKLIAWGTPRELLEASLSAVVSQRLVRVLCPVCKRRCRPPKGFSRKLRSREKVKAIYRSKGCGDCDRSGYRGLVPVQELMIPDGEMRAAVMGDPTRRTIREIARQAGMRTLRESGLDLVRDGVTSLQEVVRVVP